jgi:hypothetical protein
MPLRLRLSSPPQDSFHPPNDPATYRDLLMFEERLKSNAASLQRRKSRYQRSYMARAAIVYLLTLVPLAVLLLKLVLIIAFLLSEVFLQTSFLSLPYVWLMRKLTSDIVEPPPIIPYFASALLFVSVTTLVLFFASGMYGEKIAYANQSVPPSILFLVPRFFL